MPEYLSPGVYVEEVETGPEPIEGVSTSTTGFVGMTVRGPSAGPPVLVTSFPEFTRIFGGFIPDSSALHDSRYLPYAVKGFFDNLGQRAYIVRVLGSGNGTASDKSVLVGGLITRLAADAVPMAPVQTIQLATTRGLDTNSTITLTQTKNGIVTTELPIKITAYNDAGQVTLASKLVNSYQAQYTKVDTSEKPNTTNCELSASSPGLWGNQISVQVRQSSQAQAQVVSLAADKQTVALNTTANFYPGAIVEFNKGKTKAYKKIQAILGLNIVVTNAFANTTDLDPDLGAVTTVRTCEFDISAAYGGVTEQFRFLSMDNTLPNYYGTVINAGSTLLQMPATAAGDSTSDTPFIFPSAPDGLNLPLTGGLDGSAPAPSDYIGTDGGPGKRTGIQALADAEDIAIVAVPGNTNQDVMNALITHCETLRYRFAILDAAPHSDGSPATLQDIQTQRDLYDTKYAAIYYPRVVAFDPLTQNDITVPPSGHMAGIYARVDDERGVFKAPANEVIGGIDAIEVKVTKGDQDVLNPDPTNINVLRDFTEQGRGLRVYGARCMTSDPRWKYINVRRLFIFLEHSLDRGTQWAVFEPNDEKLWARLTQSVSAFLNTAWRSGALMGAKAEDAYFVKCDRTTMSQDDIDNGRLIMIIGVAPVFPAEFVILRIGLWDGGSAVQEL